MPTIFCLMDSETSVALGLAASSIEGEWPSFVAADQQ
jgi:hypothetical protein